MLAAKGYKTTLFLESGRRVRPRGAMLHDESGDDWPYTSILFHPFTRGGGWNDREEDEAAQDQFAIDYFGYTPRPGRLELPDDENIADWDALGEVRRINYYRPGGLPAASNSFFDLIDIWRRPEKNFRGHYEHEFKDGWLIFKTGLPRLFKRNAVYCLEFPPWSTINWRGFVTP
jgi:hypothetical protein